MDINSMTAKRLLTILDYLCDHPTEWIRYKCLEVRLKIDQPTVSHCLKMLYNIGLVKIERDSKHRGIAKILPTNWKRQQILEKAISFIKRYKHDQLLFIYQGPENINIGSTGIRRNEWICKRGNGYLEWLKENKERIESAPNSVKKEMTKKWIRITKNMKKRSMPLFLNPYKTKEIKHKHTVRKYRPAMQESLPFSPPVEHIERHREKRWPERLGLWLFKTMTGDIKIQLPIKIIKRL